MTILFRDVLIFSWQLHCKNLRLLQLPLLLLGIIVLVHIWNFIRKFCFAMEYMNLDEITRNPIFEKLSFENSTSVLLLTGCLPPSSIWLACLVCPFLKFEFIDKFFHEFFDVFYDKFFDENSTSVLLLTGCLPPSSLWLACLVCPFLKLPPWWNLLMMLLLAA